jgi:hypothetical protein
MKQAVGLIGALLLAGSVLADDVQPTKMDRLGACRAEVQKLCPNIQPGGGRIVACLRQNQASISSDCKAKLEAMAEKRHEGKGPPNGTGNGTGIGTENGTRKN